MKRWKPLAVLVSGTCLLGRPALAVNPLEKALELLAGLQQQVIKEGEVAQKLFGEVQGGCEDRSREIHLEIEQGQAKQKELKAEVEAQASSLLALTQKIQDLGGLTAESEAEIKTLTKLRNKEATAAGTKEKELAETLDALKRATSIIERSVAGGAGAPALAQLKGVGSLVQVFTVMVQASAVSDADAAQLTALLQDSSDDSEADGEEDEAYGAPSGAAYEGKSSAVTDALDGLAEKASDQLEAARKAETIGMHNFKMQKKALEAELQQQNKDMTNTKQLLGSSEEKKAGASGDLQNLAKDLVENEKVLSELHKDCMDKAAAFQEETNNRGEELKALSIAKKALEESTGGAKEEVYSDVQESSSDDSASEAPSFLQATTSSRLGSVQRAVHLVRRLATEAAANKASGAAEALAQLADRALRAVARAGDGGTGPFDKVRGMIEDMIAKLVSAADKEGQKKVYCDKEMGATTEKKEDKEDSVASLKTKIEQMSAASIKLNEEVTELSKQLGAIVRDQASIDKIRAEEKTEFERVKPEIEQGIEGVKAALQVLRDYYGGQGDSSSSGGAAGIIGALEVIESDFSKELAEMTAEEERAADEHAARTRENEVSKATKEKDVKYKTQSDAALKVATTESQADLATAGEELDAIMEYFNNIKKACTAKAEPYEERVAARAKEMAGLKEALQVMESQGGGSALVQRPRPQRSLRGGGALAP